VLAKDLLFATLDPTMRGIKLPGGTRAILSDTVGFIADLPVELVAAFRATLEEVLEADVIAHVRDISHDETAAQKADVLEVLHELGVEKAPAIEILNKIDLLPPEAQRGMVQANGRAEAPVPISALTGAGVDTLLARFEEALTTANIAFKLDLSPNDGEGLAWVYRHGRVLERADGARKIALKISIGPHDVARFEQRFGEKLQSR
jgi:GTPase